MGRKRSKGYTDAEVAEINKLYTSGLSQAKIAKLYETRQERISEYIYPENRKGSTFHNRIIEPEQVPEIISMYKNDMTTKEIAAHFKVSVSCIYHHTRGLSTYEKTLPHVCIKKNKKRKPEVAKTGFIDHILQQYHRQKYSQE